ncbi:hypothetical protein D3C85_1584190 [compost metagenome]
MLCDFGDERLGIHVHDSEVGGHPQSPFMEPDDRYHLFVGDRAQPNWFFIAIEKNRQPDASAISYDARQRSEAL